MAASPTVLTYNGVTINNCHTKKFDQIPIYDDSGTDVLYLKTTIRVTGYCTGDPSTSVVGVTPVGGSIQTDAVTNFIAIRSALLEPRNTLIMTVGDKTLFQSRGVPSNVNVSDGITLTQYDVNNGPKPRVIDVRNIAGQGVIRIEFEIECANVECDGSINVGNTSGVLGNRWTVSDDVDTNRMTRRVYQGRLRSATAQINPNAFRSLVVPPLQKGFSRRRMNFVASADGLNLDYTIEDQEAAFSPPPPATWWSVHHTESTGDGKQNIGEIAIVLKGDRQTDKRALIALGASIMEAKLQSESSNVLNQMSITDITGSDENFVEVRAEVTRVPEKEQSNIQVAVLRGLNLGAPIQSTDPTKPSYITLPNPFNLDPAPTYDFDVSPDPGLQGALPLAAAFSCYLQSSCDAKHAIGDGKTVSGITETVNPDTQAIAIVDDSVETDLEPADQGQLIVPVVSYVTVDGDLPVVNDDEYSDDDRSAMYTYYRMESKYVFSGHSIAMPIAQSVNSASPSMMITGPIQNGDTQCVISLGPRTAKRIIRVESERVGAPPEFPDPANYIDENGIRCMILDYGIVPETPDLTVDRQQIFRARGEYIYAMSRAPTDEEALRTGINPWLSPSEGGINDAIANNIDGTIYAGGIA